VVRADRAALAANTSKLVIDLWPGGLGSEVSYLVAGAGKVWFRARRTSKEGYELFSSNGTASGTRLVMDLEPGARGSNSFPKLVVGKTLYFTGWTSKTGKVGLYRTAGNASSTRRLAFGHFYGPVINAGGRPFFVQSFKSGLWTSDGTATGTLQVYGGGVASLTVAGAGQRVIFGNGSRVIRSDGTAAGTADVGWTREIALPGLPQIRTCGTTASGSSNHGLAAAR
jgi:ELWxxDGT repeat protein